MTWLIVVGSPMVLMAEHLGATAFQVGLLYSAVMLFVPLQMMAAALLPYLGYKRQIVLTWSARTVLLIIPIAIALFEPDEARPLALNIFIGTIFGYCFIRSLGACALLPWFVEIVPEKLRGRFFSADSFVIGSAGVIILLLSSALFAFFETYDAFALLFIGAICGAVTSIRFVMKLPDGKRPEVLSFPRMLNRWSALLTEPSYFRIFLLLQIVHSLTAFGLTPFTVYYLKRSLDYGISYIMFLSALQYIGMSVGALSIKDHMDRFGVRPFFVVTHAAVLFVIFYWCLLVLGFKSLSMLLPVTFFTTGMATAGYFTATNKYMAKVCRPRERSIVIALFQSTVGLTAGLAATVWGQILKDTSTGEIVGSRFLIYLGVFSVIQCYMCWGYSRIREKGLPNLQAQDVSGWNRPLRYFFGFVNLVEPRRSKKPPTP
ncbi:MAG: MFS transporter [Verrucomicrobiota bacterium]